MARFVVTRMGTLILTVLFVSFFIFVVVEVLSDASVCRRLLGQFATDEQVQACHIRLGLDRPWPVRYVEFLGKAVRLDFGVSTIASARVIDVIVPRLGNTLLLAGISFMVVMPVALALGIFAALREGKPFDHIVSVSSLTATSIPEIASGIFLLTIFAGWLGWLPAATVIPQGESLLSNPRFFVLPVLTVTFVLLGYVVRIMRASLLEVLDEGYIRAATLKGLSRPKVVVRHALRNALMAPIAVMMLHVNYLIGGLVVVESIFGYPGLGRFLLQAAVARDVFAVEGAALVLVMVAVLSQLFADVIYSYLNPRIRL